MNSILVIHLYMKIYVVANHYNSILFLLVDTGPKMDITRLLVLLLVICIANPSEGRKKPNNNNNNDNNDSNDDDSTDDGTDDGTDDDTGDDTGDETDDGSDDDSSGDSSVRKLYNNSIC